MNYNHLFLWPPHQVTLSPSKHKMGWRLCWFAWAAVTKYHGVGGLANRYFLTVLEPGPPRSGCQQFQFLVRHLLVVCRWLPPHCVLTWSFLGARVPRVSSPCVPISSSYEDTSQTGFGTTLRASLQLKYLSKGLTSKYSRILRSRS